MCAALYPGILGDLVWIELARQKSGFGRIQGIEYDASRLLNSVRRKIMRTRIPELSPKKRQ